MEYFVIGDEDTRLGFSLVGLAGATANTTEEAREAWNKAIENNKYGIIIITEKVSAMIRDIVDQYLFQQSFPLVVEIPARGEKSSKDLRTLVNEAIGVSI